MRKLERLKCSQCSTRLGEKGKGGQIRYSNPLICSECGADNTGRIREVITGQTEAQPEAESAASESIATPEQPQNVAADSRQHQDGERIAGAPLTNPRWEAFCQNFALRKCSATRAYLDAGFGSGEEAARRSASELLTKPDVLNRISELQSELARKAIEVEHWGREERIARLQRRATALDEIVAARALETENWAAPGGHTGHIVRTFKVAGGMMVDEFAVDIGLLKELRATEQQIAQELGEWLTRTAMDLRTDLPVMEVPEDASIEQIREAKRKLQEAIATFTAKPAPPQSVQ